MYGSVDIYMHVHLLNGYINAYETHILCVKYVYPHISHIFHTYMCIHLQTYIHNIFIGQLENVLELMMVVWFLFLGSLIILVIRKTEFHLLILLTLVSVVESKDLTGPLALGSDPDSTTQCCPLCVRVEFSQPLPE